MNNTHSYTQQEVHMAIGTTVEYEIPEQVWVNYTKPKVKSEGILTGGPPVQLGLYHENSIHQHGSISVYDTKLKGEVVAPYSGIIRLPFIDKIRKTNLYKMLKALDSDL